MYWPHVSRQYSSPFRLSLFSPTVCSLKYLLPFSEYKIHIYDEIETILIENGLK